MKEGPDQAWNPCIPRGQILLRLSSICPVLFSPRLPPQVPGNGDGRRLCNTDAPRSHFKTDETPSTYRSVLLPADKALPTVKNKPIKANSACRNKSDESIQADWYCLVFHPLYPSALKLDEAYSWGPAATCRLSLWPYSKASALSISPSYSRFLLFLWWLSFYKPH